MSTTTTAEASGENAADSNEDNDYSSPQQQIHGERLLKSCWDEFLKQQQQQEEEEESSSSSSHNNCLIIPTEWYYFHYPKSADNGKGFGCSIAMLLIKPTNWLMNLYQICLQKFGPDERSTNKSSASSSNNKFIPHLSLVYAPENQSEFLQNYVTTKQSQQVLLTNNNNNINDNNIDDDDDDIDDIDEYNCDDGDDHDRLHENKEVRRSLITSSTVTAAEDDETTTTNSNNNGLPVKYLSLWSTQGQIKDWYRIAKIPMFTAK